MIVCCVQCVETQHDAPIPRPIDPCVARMYFIDMTARQLHEKLAGSYRKIKGTWCVYCDGPVEAYDHFIPVSYAAYIDVKQKFKVLLPSCTSCNSTAGAKVFDSVETKRNYIISRRLKWKLKKPVHNVDLPLSSVKAGRSSAKTTAESYTTLLPIVTLGVHGPRLTRILWGYHRLKELPLATR